MIISSSSFSDKGVIPTRHTCEGRNISPPLSWSGLPKNAKSLVLIVEDPDAPSPQSPTMTWVHWILYNLPPLTHGIAEGVPSKDLPQGALQGLNDWQQIGYGGPCPPLGQHRYFHRLFALDALLPDLKSPNKRQLERAMHGHVIAQAELVGLYQRKSQRTTVDLGPNPPTGSGAQPHATGSPPHGKAMDAKFRTGD